VLEELLGDAAADPAAGSKDPADPFIPADGHTTQVSRV